MTTASDWEASGDIGLCSHWLYKELHREARMGAVAKVAVEKNERLSLRINARVKAMIQEGAALAGVDQTAFIVAAAQKAAIERIEAQQRTELTAIDAGAFFAALDNPPPPTARALAAFRRYRKDTVSR
jgi:uncharacterized protein (DUF1778 family)